MRLNIARWWIDCMNYSYIRPTCLGVCVYCVCMFILQHRMAWQPIFANALMELNKVNKFFSFRAVIFFWLTFYELLFCVRWIESLKKNRWRHEWKWLILTWICIQRQTAVKEVIHTDIRGSPLMLRLFNTMFFIYYLTKSESLAVTFLFLVSNFSALNRIRFRWIYIFYSIVEFIFAQSKYLFSTPIGSDIHFIYIIRMTW